jgi:hypothetical protein
MPDLGRDQLEAAIRALGELLEARGHHYEVVLIGGGNLILRGLVTRPTTKDLDVLGAWSPTGVTALQKMPGPLAVAIEDVALTYGLSSDWMNLGPAAILDHGVPSGFLERLERRDYGGLVLWLADRVDMICFKLFAGVDQGIRSRHLQDLRELAPTRDELLIAARWTRTHDPSPGYRALLRETLEVLGAEISDADLE